MVTIHKSHPPITEADIQAAEQELNVNFPDDYRRFLLAHNGGRPEPRVFYMPDDPSPGHNSVLRCFYCVDPSDEMYHIVRVTKVLEGRMPPEFIPIGDDAFGNQICLVISGDDKGMIFFWDHEREEEVPTYDNLYFVADNIDDLLNNRLREE